MMKRFTDLLRPSPSHGTPQTGAGTSSDGGDASAQAEPRRRLGEAVLDNLRHPRREHRLRVEAREQRRMAVPPPRQLQPGSGLLPTPVPATAPAGVEPATRVPGLDGSDETQANPTISHPVTGSSSKGKEVAAPDTIYEDGFAISREEARLIKVEHSYYHRTTQKASVQQAGLRHDMKPPLRRGRLEELASAGKIGTVESFVQHVFKKSTADEISAIIEQAGREVLEKEVANWNAPGFAESWRKRTEFVHAHHYLSRDRGSHKTLGQLVRLQLSPEQKQAVFDDVDETGRSRGLAIQDDIPSNNVLSRDDPARAVDAFRAALNAKGHNPTFVQTQRVLNEVDSGSEDES